MKKKFNEFLMINNFDKNVDINRIQDYSFENKRYLVEMTNINF